MRSFDDPPGFWPSSLAKIRTSGFGDSAWTPTIGVLPMSPRMSSWRMGAGRAQPPATAGRIETVAVGDLGVELVEVADVVVVAVHVHELVEPARVVDQLLGKARVPRDEVGEHLAHRRALGRHRRRAVGVDTQQVRQTNLDSHRLMLQVRPDRSGLTAAADPAAAGSPGGSGSGASEPSAPAHEPPPAPRGAPPATPSPTLAAVGFPGPTGQTTLRCATATCRAWAA